MTQSVPSRTALATSVHSARVGLSKHTDGRTDGRKRTGREKAKSTTAYDSNMKDFLLFSFDHDAARVGFSLCARIDTSGRRINIRTHTTHTCTHAGERGPKSTTAYDEKKIFILYSSIIFLFYFFHLVMVTTTHELALLSAHELTRPLYFGGMIPKCSYSR